ncbi:MAG TPA: acetate--CoA ligase family protein [Jatrophihabitans sp.]|nr:acetate--CoA ligase family protein [Jatrophihabitans sp.]
MADFDPQTRNALRAAGVSQQNPIDLGAAAQPNVVAAVLQSVHACAQVDTVLTVFTDIAVTDAPAIRAAVLAAAAASDKPTVGVEVGATQTTLPIPGSAHSVPIFSFAESAAAALGAAHRYACLRAEPTPPLVRPAGVNEPAARDIVTTAVAEGRDWLTPHEIAALLDAYGIPRCAQRIAGGVEEAVTAAAQLGYPVAAKLAGAGLHKTDVGDVRPSLTDEAAVRNAAAALLALDTDPPAGLLMQPMAAVELIAGGLHDRQFGPLVMLGAGGVLTDVLQDRVLRLAPVSDPEAGRMIGELRSARLLDGYRGTPPVSRAAVRDVVVRLAMLLDDLPMIAEIDLNPLICRSAAVLAVDARVRVAPAPYHPDPLVRQLRPALPSPQTPPAQATSAPQLAEPT